MLLAVSRLTIEYPDASFLKVGAGSYSRSRRQRHDRSGVRDCHPLLQDRPLIEREGSEGYLILAKALVLGARITSPTALNDRAGQKRRQFTSYNG